ncbi:MAG: 3-phosphoglycerate dehydrogenase [Candidatus Eisenbacteria bacterium]|nr:3-phosphoglycerate dehydrogenase [Candidatus Eisenbacteria bacterium]
MNRPRVVVSETLDPVCAAWLEERATVTRLEPENRTGLLAAVADADGLVVRTYTRVDSEALAAGPRLRVVGRAGVGLDNIDLPACRARGVAVVHTPDANTQAVVEYFWALVLDHIRPRHRLVAVPTTPEWHRLRTDVVGRRQLNELTLGVLGVGRIGSRVARLALDFGMRVVAHDLLGEEVVRGRVPGALEFVPPERVFAESDILTLHVDGRPANRGLITAGKLALFKGSCLFVNTARGMLVDAGALAAWARRAAPAGGAALLDVHDPEPITRDYPLLGLPNVALAPHLASRTETAMRNMSWVVRDVMEVLEGRVPEFPAAP